MDKLSPYMKYFMAIVNGSTKNIAFQTSAGKLWAFNNKKMINEGILIDFDEISKLIKNLKEICKLHEKAVKANRKKCRPKTNC